MREVLVGLTLLLTTLPATAATKKCSQIIGNSVHVTGKILGAVKDNNGKAGYVVMTAGTFNYCNSVLTAVITGDTELRCRENQEMTADGTVIGTIVEMGDAQVRASSYSCK
jgi:hypothetical protein